MNLVFFSKEIDAWFLPLLHISSNLVGCIFLGIAFFLSLKGIVKYLWLISKLTSAIVFESERKNIEAIEINVNFLTPTIFFILGLYLLVV